MALILKQPGIQPLGQFDGLDADVFTLKGGEVVQFTMVNAPNPPGTDKAAADDFDGYEVILTGGANTQKRTVVSKVASGLDGYRPFMLADEGIKNYGTLFGTVVGATAGQVSYGPNSTIVSTDLLGPHTATGSGKVTCWDKPGVYAVTLDACDTDPDLGLQPTNHALGAGNPLFVRTGGLLTPSASRALTASPNSPVVGRFIEFESNGSLVTTPNRLVAAINSPSSSVTSVQQLQLFCAVFWFDPAGSIKA